MDYDNNLVLNYWKNYCSTLEAEDQKRLEEAGPNDIWSFGDSPKMADDLLTYVLTGEKTATSGMLVDFQADNMYVPKVGDKHLILNGKREPACIIEMVDIQIKKFKDVDETFALKEAEGFKSLQDWRELHWAFFTRRCQKLGIKLNEDVDLVCHEFKLIYK